MDSEGRQQFRGFEAGDRSDANPSQTSSSQVPRITVGTGRDLAALYYSALPLISREITASNFSVLSSLLKRSGQCTVANWICPAQGCNECPFDGRFEDRPLGFIISLALRLHP